jgi:hypothetical protein
VELSVEPFHSSTDSPRIMHPKDRIDLSLIRRLPSDGIQSLRIRDTHERSMDALVHLAPGLRRLYLVWTEFSDAVLPAIAKLHELIYLQTFGNHFSDAGVQQLVALQKLEALYLEEETLTAAAVAFGERLPRLARLGLQDVTITEADLADLRRRLLGVDVGRRVNSTSGRTRLHTPAQKAAWRQRPSRCSAGISSLSGSSPIIQTSSNHRSRADCGSRVPHQGQ